MLGWYKNSVIKDLFIHCLISANFSSQPFEDIIIEKGQFVTSYENLASDLGFSVQQIRTAIKKLKSTGEITTKSTNKFTLITVVNWEDYQTTDEISTYKITSNATNEQQTDNKQITNEQQTNNNNVRMIRMNKNEENDKKYIYSTDVPHTNTKPPKHKYGEYKNVLLTDEEYEKLKCEFPNDYNERIENLSEYIASKGAKYKNHLATIRKWARKETPKENNKQREEIRYGGTYL